MVKKIIKNSNIRKAVQLLSLLLCFFVFILQTKGQTKEFNAICAAYIKGYNSLEIPETELDYKTNFSKIKGTSALQKQDTFFLHYSKRLKTLDIKGFGKEEKLRYYQLNYEINMNLERNALEMKWDHDGRKMPENGLHQLDNYKAWYSYYVKHFTSVDLTPEQVFAVGKSEVKRVQGEIKAIEMKLGFSNDASFYKFLHSDTFYLKDKGQILTAYAEIDKTVRKNLDKLFPKYDIPEIGVMEWPNATATTPPGMYLDKESNAYGKDIFQFNFYGKKHNKRSMEWLYMHEAIPGHHLQFIVRKNNKDSSSLKNTVFYFGNAEGWACYVENFGKETGLYQNDYTYLGKWEWDLVRSARLVMEVGIHYYGWSKEKALQYWKENIAGQDEIADREITRITNWAGQALCYKIGALTIKKIVNQRIKHGDSIIAAHRYLLTHSDFPLQVLLNKT